MTTTPTTSIITVEGLTKRYGHTTAVDSLSFAVPAGEVVGLLGPNGAGKTTAMKMMVGLVKPSAGTATILGVDHTDAEYASVMRRVGTLIESPALYERISARENLQLQARALGLPHDQTRIAELLALVDLTDRADDQARSYSLGMKQRLGIAVAMIGRPELVILDEPANGLDPAGIVDIRKLLRRLPEMGTTVLVSSHQLAEVQQACDRLVILTEGRLIASGTTTDILTGDTTAEWTVRVDPTEVAAATEQCHRHNLAISSQTTTSLNIEPPDGWTGRDINRLLTDAGIYATELVPQTPDLEHTFLTMTGAEQ